MAIQTSISHWHPFIRVVIHDRDFFILPTESSSNRLQSNNELSDSELLVLCINQQRVDTQIFSILVQRYEAMIYRVALRYLNNEADADDATQDTFIKAFRGLPGFRQDAQFKTWLFKILHNVCMTKFNHRKRHISSEFDELDTSALPENLNTDEYQCLIENDLIQKTLAQLNQQDRQILILRLIAELSLQETAETLGLGLSASKMRFYRAQERFIEIYNQLEPPIDTGPHDD